MKKILATLIMVIVAFGSAFAFIDSYTISRDKLPEEARQMLNEHFPKAKVSNIKIDRHLLKKTDYDVKLVNGTVIEFTNAGKWTSVDCKKKEVPEALVPSAIRKYVSKNYSSLKIVKIVKKTLSYQIGVSDGRLMKFSLLGQFKGFITEAEAEQDDAEE